MRAIGDVFAINPLPAARYRETHSASEAKSDAGTRTCWPSWCALIVIITPPVAAELGHGLDVLIAGLHGSASLTTSDRGSTGDSRQGQPEGGAGHNPCARP